VEAFPCDAANIGLNQKFCQRIPYLRINVRAEEGAAQGLLENADASAAGQRPIAGAGTRPGKVLTIVWSPRMNSLSDNCDWLR
jgi:hypothetical protein